MSAPAYAFRLYVAGNAPNSRLARANLKAIADEHLDGKYTVEEVDVLKDPRKALADQIRVTPTLIVLRPGPVRQLIGNLSEREKVLSVLGG